MTKTWVTRCPECKTSFRLTRAQLHAANGSVRCGSCLHVFKATHHIVAQQGQSSLAPSQVSRKQAEPAIHNTGPAGADKHMELSDSFRNLDAKPSSHFEDDHKVHATNQGADESWALEMLRELEAEGDASSKTQASASKAAEKDETSNTSVDDETFSGMRAEKRFVHELDSDPLSLHYVEPSSLLKRLLMLSFCLIALLGLSAQYAWFERQTLSHHPLLQDYYAQACRQLECNLNQRSSISDIHGRNLAVRSHPDFSDALIVDVIMTNDAVFDQAFPLLQLSFSKINNEVIAWRRFKPSEYLAGELAGASSMPAQTPIHIALEIKDPGQDAVNYRLSFSSEL